MADFEPEYWFARAHPLEDARKNLVPVSWKGWAVTVLFMAGALFSVASAFMWIESGNWGWALLTTPLLFILSAGIYLISVATRGDVTRTAKDYRERGGGRA